MPRKTAVPETLSSMKSFMRIGPGLILNTFHIASIEKKFFGPPPLEVQYVFRTADGSTHMVNADDISQEAWELYGMERL